MDIQERTGSRDQTLFSFLAAARRVRVNVAKSLERIGVSTVEYELLARLRVGAWCGVQEIPNDVLERLAKDGLIRRIGSGPNRAGVARITQAGRDLLEACEIQIDVVRASFAAALSAAERITLQQFLGSIP